MTNASSLSSAEPKPLTAGFLVSAGMAVFAFFVQVPFPGLLVSAIALGFVACVIGRSAKTGGGWKPLLGLGLPTTRTAAWTLLAVTVGIAFGISHRNWLGYPLLPAGVGRFAPLAMTIGVTEELVYRGFVLGRFARLGVPASIILASICHTIYKCTIFTYPALCHGGDLGRLVEVTLLGGLVFGAMRHYGRHLLPSAVAHAVFDVIVYGDLSTPPWWVWS